MTEALTVKKLYTLDQTIAKDIFEGVTYPWEVLPKISSFILELVTTIQAHDPNALIIVQSDHGSRQANHFYDMGIWDTYDPTVENPYMQNTLNCVYYQNQSFAIEGETGINTMRMVFNQVLGTELAPITPVQDYSNNYVDEQS